MIKKYQFSYDDLNGSAVFTVDTEKFSETWARETLNFFNWNYNKEANPIDEVMKKYAIEAIKIATFNHTNLQGVINEFKNKEGFCPVDNSFGIQLTQVRAYYFDDDLLEMIVS